MSSLPNLFEVCTPREDILQGAMTEAEYAADLAQVLNGTAPKQYQDPALFFATTHPTRGLRNLLHNVCLRLGGKSGQVASIFRLDTNYGGGKTHALIALAHAARGMQGVANISEFLPEELVPATPVHVAAFDGENADPVNGHAVGEGMRAYTPWGEIAYALGGARAYSLVRKSDEQGIAPGADTIKELFGEQPTLILMDELSVYLRKQGADDLKSAAHQLTAFLTALFKAVESSPNAALVYTLAIGKNDKKASDAYSLENETIAEAMQEAESVSARKATLLDPTEEDETVKVLRRRLFAHIDDEKAAQIVEAYARLWEQNKEYLPAISLKEERREEFEKGFPLHPELIETLKEKTSTLGNFQRVRGMLRLLARTISRLWKQKPQETYAVHLHHIDLSFSPIRQEIITKLGQKAFVPALKADIAASEGDTLSLAEWMDEEYYKGMAPYTSFIARSIFFHTLAFNDNLKGATKNELRFAILSPGMDVSFIGDAIRRFRQESAYLDEREEPLRFMAEPNLNHMIHRREKQIAAQDVRARLNDTIKNTFSGKVFSLAPFPAAPNDIADSAEKPQLAVIGYDAAAVAGNSTKLSVPNLIISLFKEKSEGTLRLNRNNLVFVIAEENKVEDMKAAMTRRLALEDMKNDSALKKDLADYQREELSERYRKSEQALAISIQQAYRHVFYPSKDNKPEDSPVDLAHTTIEVQNASANPGAGQSQIVRVLVGANKFRQEGDQPDSPDYIIKKTPLHKGYISTADLRNEYCQNTALAMLAADSILVKAIKNGINQGEFVYQKGELVWGKGAPSTYIEINDQAEVLTAWYAKENNIWPHVSQTDTDGTGGTNTGTGGTETGTGTGTGGNSGGNSGGNTGGSTGGGGGDKPPLPIQKELSCEALLKEALIRIWEDAKSAGWQTVNEMQISIYDAQNAFALLGPIGTLGQCEKNVKIVGNLKAQDGSVLNVEFEGTPAAALQIRDFLLPQYRIAANKDMEATITLTFTNGLSLTSLKKDEFTAKLTRIGSGNAYVKIQATEKRDG